MKPLHMLMLAALAVAAWLAFFGDKTPNSDVAEAVKRTVAGSASAKGAPTQRAAAPDDSTRTTEKDGAAKKPKRDVVILAVRDRKELIGGASSGTSTGLFGTQSWAPPPPPPVNPGPPPPPTAPALPFTFLGKKSEDAAWEVYLAHGDSTLIVHEKSVIEGTYRVDSIKPPLLTLTYLPMNQQQTLPIGGTE